MSGNLQWILCAVQEFDISISRAIELIECDRAGKFTDDMMPADACSRRVFGFDDVPIKKYEELLAERDSLAAKLANIKPESENATLTPSDELELRADIFRDMINELRDTAKTFHNHDSLRERLRGVVNKFIKVQL